MFEIVVIGVAALLTSILSAVAGLGGGVILLLVIAQFVAPTTAIPIQGAIQLVSNGSRTMILRRSVAWPVVGWSSLLLLPGSLLGVTIATSVPDDAVRVALSVFVLVLTWRPQWLKLQPPPPVATDGSRSPADDDLPANRRPMLIALGGASGVLNTTVGASGPVTSPFFKAVTATHIAFVATAAATQTIAHISKLVAFTTEGWSVADHADVIAVGIAGVVAGTWIGTRLLGRLSSDHLDLLFKVVLTALATRLLVTAIT